MLLPLQCFAQSTDYNTQLTNAALMIEGAISPACNATDSCVQFTTYVIPRCERLQGDAGCWCGNHDPLHYCAICMSNPSDNRTTPDQTAAATLGHSTYHQVCNQFEAALNASATASAGASSTSGIAATGAASSTGASSKTPIGPIVGGVVGGVAVILAIIVLVVWMRRRNGSKPGPSSVSLFSAAGTSTGLNPGGPYPGYAHTEATFVNRDSVLSGPGYAPPGVPHQGMGMRPPNMMGNGSYNKYPEPMAPY